MKFKTAWQSCTSAEKEQWAELALSTKRSMDQRASISKDISKAAQRLIAQGYIEMGKSRSKKVDVVERYLFGDMPKKSGAA